MLVCYNLFLKISSQICLLLLLVFHISFQANYSKQYRFVGLQGSYARGEATEASDIDVVVVLDELYFADLQKYRDMLDTLPNRNLICGFVCAKKELLNWEPSDLFQFYYDTTPIKGTLDILLEKIDKQAVKRAIKIGACNIYHACVHNFVHEKSDEILRSLYKSAVFVIQAIYFYENDKYLKSTTELLNAINPSSCVIEIARNLKSGARVEYDKMSKLLIDWATAVIGGYSE